MSGIPLPLRVVFTEIRHLNHFRQLLFPLILCFASLLHGQSATITGVILDENNRPLRDVSIREGQRGTTSDADGFYLLEVESDLPLTISFSHIGHQKIELRDIVLVTNQVFAFNPVMKTDAIQIDSVEVTASGRMAISGIATISPGLAQKIPSANSGVESLLKLLPGVF